jgi:hypothetical protein
MAWMLIILTDFLWFSLAIPYKYDWAMGSGIIVRFLAGANNFPYPQGIQAGSGVHPASFSMRTGGSFGRDKAVGA